MSDVVTERLQHLFETVRRPDGKRWTLKEVADGTGLSLSYVWRLRSGKAVNPTRAVLEKLASFFGVPVTYLMTEIGGNSVPAALADKEEIQRLLQAARDHSSAGDHVRAAQLAREAAEKSQALGDRSVMAWSLATLARVLASADRLQDAREVLAQALELVHEAPGSPGWIQAVLVLSYIEYQEDRFSPAYFHARQAVAALELARADKSLRYEALFHAGTLAREVGQIDEATAWLEQARQVAEELGDRYMAPVLMGLGLAALDQERPDVALDHFSRTLGLSVRLRFPPWVNRCQHNMGLALERLGRWHEAIESLVKSLGSHEALGDTQVTVYDHMELGWCYANIGQRESALRHAYMALALAQEHERAAYKARAHWHLGRVLAVLGDAEEAARQYGLAADLLEQLQLRSELARVWVEWGDLLSNKGGNAAEAAELYRKAALCVMRTPALDGATGARPSAMAPGRA